MSAGKHARSQAEGGAAAVAALAAPALGGVVMGLVAATAAIALPVAAAVAAVRAMRGSADQTAGASVWETRGPSGAGQAGGMA